MRHSWPKQFVEATERQGKEANAAVAAIDPCAYVTGFYPLFLNHLVTQVPMEITCFTNWRHERQEILVTPTGRLRFICVPDSVYDQPSGATSSEQALCDFAWLMVQEGFEPLSLLTFYHLDSLRKKDLRDRLKKYPQEARQAVDRILQSVAAVALRPGGIYSARK